MLSDDAVLRRLSDRLRGGANGLVEDGLLDRGLEAQAISIVEEVRMELHALTVDHPNPSDIAYGGPEDLIAHGELAAMQGVAPSEALMAGEALFDSIIDELESDCDFRSQLPDLVIARTAHHAVWRRFAPGASAYVNHLRQQLQDAHFEGRRRYSRFLHDQLAHDIAAAIQRLELSMVERPSDQYIETALEILHATAAATRDFAFDVRQEVGSKGLEEAISRYIDECVTSIPVEVTRDGDQSHLLAAVAQEILTIFIEAFRNALTHGSTTRGGSIRVSITWASDSLALKIMNDALDASVPNPGSTSLGLRGMQERAAALGGSFTLAVFPGVRVALIQLPLTGRRHPSADPPSRP